jgi:hypothetical protein
MTMRSNTCRVMLTALLVSAAAVVAAFAQPDTQRIEERQKMSPEELVAIGQAALAASAADAATPTSTPTNTDTPTYPCATVLVDDYNHDCVVDEVDLFMLMQWWRDQEPTPTPVR